MLGRSLLHLTKVVDIFQLTIWLIVYSHRKKWLTISGFSVALNAQTEEKLADLGRSWLALAVQSSGLPDNHHRPSFMLRTLAYHKNTSVLAYIRANAQSCCDGGNQQRIQVSIRM